MKSKESVIKTIVIVLMCSLLAVSVFILVKGWLGGHFSSIETLRQYIDSFGLWGPIVLTLIQALQVILIYLSFEVPFSFCRVLCGMFYRRYQAKPNRGL